MTTEWNDEAVRATIKRIGISKLWNEAVVRCAAIGRRPSMIYLRPEDRSVYVIMGFVAPGDGRFGMVTFTAEELSDPVVMEKLVACCLTLGLPTEVLQDFIPQGRN